MLYGNHEYHIQDYVLGKPCKKQFFLEKTLPALRKKFNKSDFKRFVRILKDYYAYSYCGKKVIVTHGGIAKIDDRFNLLPGYQARFGVGNYKDDISSYFEINNHEWIQIYGHRTCPQNKESNISININSNPEIDNKLNVATLNVDGNLTKEAILI
jgi:hypothetical protein